jgi:hypothetical protein
LRSLDLVPDHLVKRAGECWRIVECHVDPCAKHAYHLGACEISQIHNRDRRCVINTVCEGRTNREKKSPDTLLCLDCRREMAVNIKVRLDSEI